MPHDRMLASRNTYTWIQKYIFPGGLLPSVEAIDRRSPSASTRAAVTDRHASARTTPRRCGCGGSGSTPIRPRSRPRLRRDVPRMWSLYLAYSEAGFRAGYLDVSQLTLEKQEMR